MSHYPGAGVTGDCEQFDMGHWELSPGLQQEEYVISTTALSDLDQCHCHSHSPV